MEDGTSSSSFKEQFERWLVDQERDLHELISTVEDTNRRSELRGLTRRVMEHYEEYYRKKSEWAHRNVLSMMSPSWRTTLEDAFLWIGGWRPSMAFHLIYSKSGLQLDSMMQNLLRGLPTTSHDLADLSSEQLSRMDELQRRTIREERNITEEIATVQESVADASMVELSHVASQMMMMEGGQGDGDDWERVMEDRVERTLVTKERRMERVLRMADDLRLTTLKTIVEEVLNPVQAAHFLIAVAELHLRVHDWGKRRDQN
ncbi:Protein DELAY OF GERMINATION 1 [Linum perenne]